ncbi:MAG: DUF2059 domain-containing protein [Rhodobacteraceae bacterium]|nr:DUF2059 domain-containing protein [Paracoccaceae bacterium]
MTSQILETRGVGKRVAVHAALVFLMTAPAAVAQQSSPPTAEGMPIERLLGEQIAQDQTAPSEAPETSRSVGGVPVEDLIEVEDTPAVKELPTPTARPINQGVPVEQLLNTETPPAATNAPASGAANGASSGAASGAATSTPSDGAASVSSEGPLIVTPPPQPATVNVAPSVDGSTTEAQTAPAAAPATNATAAPTATVETPAPSPIETYDPRAAADPSAPTPPPGITSLKLAKADRIYDLTFPRGQIQWMMRSVAPSLVEALKYESARVGAPPPPDLETRVQAIVADEMLGLEEEMRPAIVPIYAVELTEQELDELLKLYSSEEGRSMMAKMQVLSGAVANEMRGVIERFNTRVGDRIETELLPKPE